MLLILAIAALLAGPLLLELGRAGPGFRSFLDGFVFVAVASLLIFGILPEAGDVIGPGALVLAGVGVLLPLAAEALLHRASHKGTGGHDAAAGHRHDPVEDGMTRALHRGLLVLGVLGLILHGIIDGLILLGAEVTGHQHGDPGHAGADADAHDPADELGLAVILHNLPKGMAIWLLVGATFGRTAALLVLALLPVATAAGFLAGGEVLHLLGGNAIAGFQAFAVGSILHVLLHGAGSHSPATAALETATGTTWPGRLGLVAGLVFLYAYL